MRSATASFNVHLHDVQAVDRGACDPFVEWFDIDGTGGRAVAEQAPYSSILGREVGSLLEIGAMTAIAECNLHNLDIIVQPIRSTFRPQ